MIFKVLLVITLVVLVAGLAFRLQTIARKQRFFEKDQDTWAKKIFFLDPLGFLSNTLFQARLLKADKLRWLAHALVISGFMYLGVVHALDDLTSGLFSGYQPGVEPFRFLRNLAGVSVIVGCFMFLLRRLKKSRIHQDRINQARINKDRGFWFRGVASILLILGLVGSGFLLEAARIMSEPRFDEMVEDYSGVDDEAELAPLKLLWAQNYHVVFSKDLLAEDPEQGESMNEEYCLDCHQIPDTAFVSTPMAKMAKVVGPWLARARVDNILYWFHYGIALVLLGFLPFSRMFHLLAVPLASFRKRTTGDQVKNEMGFFDVFTLSACTNCGLCSEVCSVTPNFQVTGNPETLPHVKIDAVNTMAGKGLWNIKTVSRLRSGNDDCTLCGRCADVCPSGIDLVRLWGAADTLLANLGCPDNYTQALDASFDLWTKNGTLPGDLGGSLSPGLADQVEAFENCVQCTICTNGCPVVAHDLNQNDIGPHQVMNLLRLGKKQMATGSRMVWHCLTCYYCQELCPQGIRVADILLELREGGHKTADRIKMSHLTIQVSDK